MNRRRFLKAAAFAVAATASNIGLGNQSSIAFGTLAPKDSWAANTGPYLFGARGVYFDNLDADNQRVHYQVSKVEPNAPDSD